MSIIPLLRAYPISQTSIFWMICSSYPLISPLLSHYYHILIPVSPNGYPSIIPILLYCYTLSFSTRSLYRKDIDYRAWWHGLLYHYYKIPNSFSILSHDNTLPIPLSFCYITNKNRLSHHFPYHHLIEKMHYPISPNILSVSLSVFYTLIIAIENKCHQVP